MASARSDYVMFRREEGLPPLAAAWWVVRTKPDEIMDGPIGRRCFQLRHPPIEIGWHPQINLRLRRRNPLFWLLLLFGEA